MIKINNTQIDDVLDMDVVMCMYNLIEHSDFFRKTSWRLWQYYRDEPALGGTNNIFQFPANNNNSVSLKFKEIIIGQNRKRCHKGY